MIELRHVLDFLPDLSTAFVQTILNSVLIFVTGMLLAMLHQITSALVVPNWISKGWSFWWRSVPEVSVIVLVYYGIGGPMNALGPREIGIMVLSLISSAYISLLIRAAHEQLDPRQVESARALGISRLRTQRLIVWPQILKHLRFPMIMYYADVVKQSALLSVIGVYGATMEAYRLGSDTFRYLEALVVVAALFFLYISVVEYLARLVGNKRRASPNDRVWWDRP